MNRPLALAVLLLAGFSLFAAMGSACTTSSECGQNQICSAGACVCGPGFGDCDGSGATGCETYLLSNPNNCGGCDVICASGVCKNAVCTEHCANGLDDDGDGAADQADTDCQTVITGTVVEADISTPIPGATIVLKGLAQLPLISCALKGACSASESCTYQLSGSTNAHAGSCTGAYPSQVCCRSNLAGCTVGCAMRASCAADEATVVSLSDTTNAHLEGPAVGGYAQDICCKVSGAGCQGKTIGPCKAYAHGGAGGCEPGHACVGSLSATTNAHGGACNLYPVNICCQAPQVPATLEYTLTSQADGAFGQVVAGGVSYDAAFSKAGYTPKTILNIASPTGRSSDLGPVPLEREVGGCNSDCVLTSVQVCSAGCTVNPACGFYDDTAKTLCDGKLPGTRVQYGASGTLVCCEGTPFTGSKAEIVSDKTIVSRTVPTTYGGRPIHVVVVLVG